MVLANIYMCLFVLYLPQVSGVGASSCAFCRAGEYVSAPDSCTGCAVNKVSHRVWTGPGVCGRDADA